MGGKKKDRVAQEKLKLAARGRGRDSEDAESETSVKSGTSSQKQRLAQTRAALREAGADALRMAAAHETPTETPIYGPGNIFDAGDDDDDDIEDDEIETLREANDALKRRLRKYNSTVGAATKPLSTVVFRSTLPNPPLSQLLFLVLPPTSLALVARPLLPVPTRRVLDAANALITAALPMGRFVSFVPQTPLSWPMSVLLPRLQHLLSLVTLSRSITLL
jgi:hypothetical protein